MSGFATLVNVVFKIYKIIHFRIDVVDTPPKKNTII